MHRPSEPEDLRQGARDTQDAPCNCTCKRTDEAENDTPAIDQAVVQAAVTAEMGGG